MQKIDAHQHFWKFDPVRDEWITEEMNVLRQDFLPGKLLPLLTQHGFDGCVAVQADQSEEETDFLLSLASEFSFIKGVVGWIDLRNNGLESKLEGYRNRQKLKGFRHILQGETRRDAMLDPGFKKGISLLETFGFTYDILIYPDQLPFICKFVSSFPQQKFVIDHLAKPAHDPALAQQWKTGMKELGKLENVYCKISGLVTEGAAGKKNLDDVRPYIDTVVNSFGTGRIMFGSDWPVCLLQASYTEVIQLVQDYFSSFSHAEQESFFGGNAIEFYNLFP
jgi:L-fuconolactonase